jgi:hypothetical protein
MCRCLRDEYRRRGADKDKKKARGPESSGAGLGGIAVFDARLLILSSLSLSLLSLPLLRACAMSCVVVCVRPAVVASDARPPLQ